MRNLKTLLLLSLSFIVFVVGVLFTVNNQQPVSVDVLWWKSPEFPLGVLLMMVLLLGSICGVIINVWVVARLAQQRRKLQKQLDQSAKRFEQLQ